MKKLLGTHQKYKPYLYKSNFWKKITIGVNHIFSISLYKNGIVITICQFGTILKKYEISIGVNPFECSKINY